MFFIKACHAHAKHLSPTHQQTLCVSMFADSNAYMPTLDGLALSMISVLACAWQVEVKHYYVVCEALLVPAMLLRISVSD